MTLTLESSEYRDHMAKVQLTEKAMAHAKKLLVPWSTEDLAEGLRQANSSPDRCTQHNLSARDSPNVICDKIVTGEQPV